MTRARPTFIEQDPRWQAWRAGHLAALPAGLVYALRSDGHYLRPQMGAGLPDPGDVELFDSAAEAEAAVSALASVRCVPVSAPPLLRPLVPNTAPTALTVPVAVTCCDESGPAVDKEPAVSAPAA